MADSVSVGVVGLNYWGPNLARNFDRTPRARLTWCCDLDEDTLNRHRPAFNGARFTTKIEDLLGDRGEGRGLALRPALAAVLRAVQLGAEVAQVQRSVERAVTRVVEEHRDLVAQERPASYRPAAGRRAFEVKQALAGRT